MTSEIEQYHRQKLKELGYKDEAIEEIVFQYIKNCNYEFAEAFYKHKQKQEKPKVVIVGQIGNEGRSHLEALAINHDLVFAQTSIDSIKTESLEKLIKPIKIEPLSDIGKLKTYLPEKGSKYHK